MNVSRFITQWTHPSFAPDPVAESELESTEGRLETRLPAEYREAVLQFGLPRPTSALLEAIVDQELRLRDVSDFLSPSEIVSVTEDWRELGLPEQFVAFATDCMGNLFCFPKNSEASDELPVYYFNHDSGAVDKIASTSSQWIDEFCSVTPN